MKTIFILLLFFSNSLQAQIADITQTSEDQLNYFKSNPSDLKDGNGNNIFNSNVLDTIILSGANSGQNSFGISVSTAGDVNGDGYSDVIVGAPYGNNSKGNAYIFFGGINLDNIADVSLSGEVISDDFGCSVSTAGDVNGDGYSDVIVGAYNYNGQTGRAYIYFGGSSMNNVSDITLNGQGSDDLFGASVSTAGDVNGDNYADVIIGAYSYNTQRGRAYIFYGGSSMNNISDVILTGETFSSYFGCSVSNAGDVNGDNYSDVIVGSYNYSSGIGRAYIFLGGSIMNNIADLFLTGEALNSYFGCSVAGAGDVNGDGYSDVIVGAYGHYSSGSIGKTYIFYGGSFLNNVADIILVGEAYDSFGFSVSCAGDINNDGFSDVIIGAYEFNNYKGKVYIYYGGIGMDNIADIILTGESTSDRFGFSVSCAGDVNGDGYSDFIVGADGFNSQFGRSYVFMTKHDFIRINLKVLMEGMYYQFFNQMIRKDTVCVYLRNNTSPYNIVDSAKGVIDSLNFSGLFIFKNVTSGTYYIIVKHINSIETWSKLGGETLVNNNSVYTYDFTTSASKAYGNNQKLKGSKYCIYGGNVNGDAIVDGGDLSEVDNDSFTGLTGRFLRSDVNGDNFVDAADVSLVDNNSFINILKITP